MKQYIFLIPGFFGFSDLGRITYFHHVREHLAEVFEELGVDAEAERPGLRTTLNVGLDPYRQASNAIYGLFSRITARVKEDFPPLTAAQSAKLVDAYGELPTNRDNDGMCPTLSQVYDEVIHAAKADHLDVCGHFTGPDHDPPHVDWLCTGSRFDREGFETMWRGE